VIDVIYLDFAKAFDTVPHERLKKKLKAHGIGSNVLKWMAERQKTESGFEWQRIVMGGGAVGGPTGQRAGPPPIYDLYK
jgi:hypothetical protein